VPSAQNLHSESLEVSAARHEQRFAEIGHLIHAFTFFVLLATGILLFSPTIRSRVVGGYSLSLGMIHWWTGIAFVLVTLPVARHPFRLARNGSGRGAPSPEERGRHWRRFHLLFTLGSAVVFTATGLVLWFRGSFSLEITDASATIHLWLTYLATMIFAAHLTAAVIALRASRERPVDTAPTRNAGATP
jgi:cytochrome b subunit of formate dehydrogenase